MTKLAQQERLEQIRAESGLSRKAFWLQAGGDNVCSYRSATRYHRGENDDPSPSMDYLSSVSRNFNVRLDWLANGTGPRSQAAGTVEDQARQELAPLDPQSEFAREFQRRATVFALLPLSVRSRFLEVFSHWVDSFVVPGEEDSLDLPGLAAEMLSVLISYPSAMLGIEPGTHLLSAEHAPAAWDYFRRALDAVDAIIPSPGQGGRPPDVDPVVKDLLLSVERHIDERERKQLARREEDIADLCARGWEESDARGLLDAMNAITADRQNELVASVERVRRKARAALEQHLPKERAQRFAYDLDRLAIGVIEDVLERWHYEIFNVELARRDDDLEYRDGELRPAGGVRTGGDEAPDPALRGGRVLKLPEQSQEEFPELDEKLRTLLDGEGN